MDALINIKNKEKSDIVGGRSVLHAYAVNYIEINTSYLIDGNATCRAQYTLSVRSKFFPCLLFPTNKGGARLNQDS